MTYCAALGAPFLADHSGLGQLTFPPWYIGVETFNPEIYAVTAPGAVGTVAGLPVRTRAEQMAALAWAGIIGGPRGSISADTMRFALNRARGRVPNTWHGYAQSAAEATSSILIAESGDIAAIQVDAEYSCIGRWIADQRRASRRFRLSVPDFMAYLEMGDQAPWIVDPEYDAIWAQCRESESLTPRQKAQSCPPDKNCGPSLGGYIATSFPGDYDSPGMPPITVDVPYVPIPQEVLDEPGYLPAFGPDEPREVDLPPIEPEPPPEGPGDPYLLPPPPNGDADGDAWYDDGTGWEDDGGANGDNGAGENGETGETGETGEDGEGGEGGGWWDPNGEWQPDAGGEAWGEPMAPPLPESPIVGPWPPEAPDAWGGGSRAPLLWVAGGLALVLLGGRRRKR